MVNPDFVVFTNYQADDGIFTSHHQAATQRDINKESLMK